MDYCTLREMNFSEWLMSVLSSQRQDPEALQTVLIGIALSLNLTEDQTQSWMAAAALVSTSGAPADGRLVGAAEALWATTMPRTGLAVRRLVNLTLSLSRGGSKGNRWTVLIYVGAWF